MGGTMRFDVGMLERIDAHRAGDAMATWVWGHLWSTVQETDGFVPRHILRISWCGQRVALEHMGRLVACRLAAIRDDGWQLLGNDAAGETVASRHARRAAARERQAAYRLRPGVIARDGLVCHICRLPVELDDVHVDHVIPLSRGGRSVPENLKVSHSACNVRKGARI